MKRVAIARRLGQTQARQAGEEDRQRHCEFEARKRRPDAEMNAGAEAHMGVRRPPAVEAVGIRKALGIAIGGPKQKADLLALLEAHAGQLHVLERVTGEEVQRRVEPQAAPRP